MNFVLQKPNSLSSFLIIKTFCGGNFHGLRRYLAIQIIPFCLIFADLATIIILREKNVCRRIFSSISKIRKKFSGKKRFDICGLNGLSNKQQALYILYRWVLALKKDFGISVHWYGYQAWVTERQ